MKKRPIIIVMTILLIGGFVTAGVVSKNRTKLTKVPAVQVAAEEFKREISANGEIVAAESARILSLVSGRIDAVYVETGDRVVQGDLLVKVDDEDVKLQYQQALASLEATRRQIREELLNLRSAYTQAISSYRQADRDLKRIKELHKIGSASDEELRLKEDAFYLADQNLESALQRINFREGRELDDPRSEGALSDKAIVENSTEVKQALLSVRTLASTLEDYRFRSSISGLVTALSAEEGGILSPGAPVGTIHNTDNLEVLSRIDEVDLSYVKTGQDVRIESDSFISKELTGRVKKIDPVIQRIGDSRVCEIRVSITGDEEQLAIIGAGCSIFILVEKKQDVPSIPVEAYRIEKGEQFVFLLEESELPGVYTTRKQLIKTGIIGIDTVEVTEGLEVGNLIAASNLTTLLDEMEVEIDD
jgi:HlyD family secretion protein